MSKNLLSTKENSQSKIASIFGARARMRSPRLKNISDEKLTAVLTAVRQNLDKGLSGAAERSLVEMLEHNALSLEQQAKIQRQLSYILETQGRYKESLEAIAS